VERQCAQGRIGPERGLLAQPVVALDLRQQHFSPALGAVHVARPQLGCQAVAFCIEQQQGVITGRFEVPVVRALRSCSPYTGPSLESVSRIVRDRVSIAFARPIQGTGRLRK